MTKTTKVTPAPEGMRKAIPLGAEFTLYGFALGAAGRILGSAERRIKIENGSKHIPGALEISARDRGEDAMVVTVARFTDGLTGDSWPNTKTGRDAAWAWSAKMNVEAGERECVFVPIERAS